MSRLQQSSSCLPSMLLAPNGRDHYEMSPMFWFYTILPGPHHTCSLQPFQRPLVIWKWKGTSIIQLSIWKRTWEVNSFQWLQWTWTLCCLRSVEKRVLSWRSRYFSSGRITFVFWLQSHWGQSMLVGSYYDSLGHDILCRRNNIKAKYVQLTMSGSWRYQERHFRIAQITFMRDSSSVNAFFKLFPSKDPKFLIYELLRCFHWGVQFKNAM